MGATEELWAHIKGTIEQEGLVENRDLSELEKKILAGRIKADDWKVAVENVAMRGDRNG